MDKEIMVKRLEDRISAKQKIYEFHMSVINLIGTKKQKEPDLSKTLIYAVRSAGKVLELIEQDKTELRRIKYGN